MNDSVVVITVCFNCLPVIERTICSVLSQRYLNFKYFMIDGGSTDGTVDVIERYSDKLAFWISEPDKGIYDAMNKGLSFVEEGSWVVFMNAGDVFVSDDILTKIFENRSYVNKIVIYGNTILRYEDRCENFECKDISFINRSLPFCHQSSFVRKSEEIFFDLKYKMAADYDLFYRIYNKYGSCVFCRSSEFIAEYEMENSTSLNNQKKTAVEYFKIRSRNFSLDLIFDVVVFYLKTLKNKLK